MSVHQCWMFRLLVPLTLTSVLVAVRTPAEAAGNADYAVSLRMGLNEVVYRGPSPLRRWLPRRSTT